MSLRAPPWRRLGCAQGASGEPGIVMSSPDGQNFGTSVDVTPPPSAPLAGPRLVTCLMCDLDHSSRQVRGATVLRPLGPVMGRCKHVAQD
jgi:hypothetical protein